MLRSTIERMGNVADGAARRNMMAEASGSSEEIRSTLAMMNAMSLLKSSKSNAKEVAIALKFDPRLADNIVKEVNSPFYGLRNRVESLEQAIALLGFKRISDLLQNSSTHDMYKKVENSYFELRAFQRHGVAV